MPLDLFYFISSLPGLRLGEAPKLSYGDFLEKCRNALSIKDLRRIENFPAEKGELESQWIAWERFMRNAIVEERAARLHVNPSLWRRGEKDFRPADRKAVEEAFAKSSPMERETALDSLRWRALEELAVTYPFCVEALIIYSLQLQILEHRQSRQEAPGAATCESLVEQGFAQALQVRQSSQN